MNHSLLSSPSNQRSRPTDAAGYVLGNVDWKKEERDMPPMILSGSREQFIGAASRVLKGPAYLSTTLSDQGDIEVPKIRYCSDLYSTHYFAGIPREEIGELSVLHKKEKGWDAHKLIGVAIRGSSKKARFLRKVADYLRFAWLTSSINRLFGWEDPLDPRNYCPFHVRESWWDKPEIISHIEKEIATGLRENRIHDREDILEIVRQFGLNPVADDRQIEIAVDNERWTFVGYAATAHADSPKKLAAHRERTAKPFRDLRDHPSEIQKRLIFLYRKRVQENAAYYGIQTLEASSGLIVPNAEYFKNHYEERQKDTGRTYTEPSAKLDRAGDPQLLGVAATILCRDRGTDRRNQSPQGESYITGKAPLGVGETAVGPGRNHPPYRTAAESDGSGDYDDGIRVQKRLQELGEDRRRIEEWVRLIVRFLKIPGWLRKLRASRKKEAEKYYSRFPEHKHRPIPKRIAIILRNPAAFHFLPDFGQPDTDKPMPAGPADPKTQEIVPDI